jgi:hypothetical protein
MSWHAGCYWVQRPRVVNNHQATSNLVAHMWQVKVTRGGLCISACCLHVVWVQWHQGPGFKLWWVADFYTLVFIMPTLCPQRSSNYLWTLWTGWPEWSGNIPRFEGLVSGHWLAMSVTVPSMCWHTNWRLYWINIKKYNVESQNKKKKELLPKGKEGDVRDRKQTTSKD